MSSADLFAAIQEGNLHRVREILADTSSPIDISRAKRSSFTPLMYAICRPEAGIDMVRLLIQSGATIDQNCISLALGDLPKLTEIIDAGADILYTRDKGYDALINAAYQHNVRDNPQLLDILKLLIAKGVSLRGMTSYGESAVRVLSRIGRFDAVELLLKAGANPDDVKLTPLIEATAFGSLSDMKRILESGANLEERDHWEKTAWLIAIQTGIISKAKFLLEQGADRNARGRCGRPPLFYAIESGRIPMLNWLLEIGQDVEQTDEFGCTTLRHATDHNSVECIDILLRAGADVDRESKTGTALANAHIRDVALRLIDSGADPQHLTNEARRSILGYQAQSDIGLLDASKEDFQSNRSRRFADRNAQVMNNSYWEAMIRSGVNASQAAGHFGYDEVPVGKWRAIWCAQRFGQSLTFLPDGRIVQVAGEHEDWYDTDFCIYNDVFVHAPNGILTIYGYPEAVFPPTDFHTATLIGQFIYLIGALGYPESRKYGETPVFRLDTSTFEIERIQTTGDNPGWIHRHRAILSAPGEIRVTAGKIVTAANGNEVHTDSAAAYILDVERLIWRSEPSIAGLY